MNQTGRRSGMAACVAVATLAVATGALLLQRRSRAIDEARAAADSRATAARIVDEYLRDLERDVRAGAAIPQLVAALRQRVDAATIVDLFENEEWWRSYRDRAAAIVIGQRIAVRHRALPDEAVSAAIVADARAKGSSSALLTQPQLLLVAAAPLGIDDAVLVLGRQVEPAWVGAQTAAPATPPAGASIVAAFVVAGLGLAGAIGLGRKRTISGEAIEPWEPPAGVVAAKVRPSAIPAPSRATGPGAPTLIATGQGQVFGRYTLLERIGEGGMAEIFLASLAGAEGFKRRFVVKRLKPDLASNKEAIAQFIDEAKLGSELVHSNIVSVVDFGKAGDGYFLAQEFFPGRNLYEIGLRLVEQEARVLPAHMVYYVAHEALLALAYAHERSDDAGVPLRLVHRDVSPTNVMVSGEGEVKLIDFGIVKAETRLARTGHGAIKGNAGYMSPEQARGLQVDARSDLFSLALVMFDLLTGDVFYQGRTTGEVLYQAATGPTADHLARLRKLPDPAASILQRALALDPAGRFQTAREFADALASHVAGAKQQLGDLMKHLFGDALVRPVASPARVQVQHAGGEPA